MSKPKPKRIAETGKRHRRDNGPAALEVKEVEPLSPDVIGQLHAHTHALISGGPDALIAAELEAARLSAKFGEEVIPEWCLPTKWLQQLIASNRGREHEQAEYALIWRPRFLAVVALTRSVWLGTRAAKVAYNTMKNQRRLDSEFEEQIVAAKEKAVTLLTDMTMRSAIEGEMKPIYWQGIRVGFEPQYDNRLRIEMLRAYKPDRFKTPGSKVNVNTGNQIFTDNVIFDGPVMDNLIAMRGEALRLIAEKRAQATVVGTTALPPVPPTA